MTKQQQFRKLPKAPSDQPTAKCGPDFWTLKKSSKRNSNFPCIPGPSRPPIAPQAPRGVNSSSVRLGSLSHLFYAHSQLNAQRLNKNMFLTQECRQKATRRTLFGLFSVLSHSWGAGSCFKIKTSSHLATEMSSLLTPMTRSSSKSHPLGTCRSRTFYHKKIFKLSLREGPSYNFYLLKTIEAKHSGTHL